jgi:hypothetical protein
MNIFKYSKFYMKAICIGLVNIIEDEYGEAPTNIMVGT